MQNLFNSSNLLLDNLSFHLHQQASLLNAKGSDRGQIHMSKTTKTKQAETTFIKIPIPPIISKLLSLLWIVPLILAVIMPAAWDTLWQHIDPDLRDAMIAAAFIGFTTAMFSIDKTVSQRMAAINEIHDDAVQLYQQFDNKRKVIEQLDNSGLDPNLVQNLNEEIGGLDFENNEYCKNNKLWRDFVQKKCEQHVAHLTRILGKVRKGEYEIEGSDGMDELVELTQLSAKDMYATSLTEVDFSFWTQEQSKHYLKVQEKKRKGKLYNLNRVFILSDLPNEALTTAIKEQESIGINTSCVSKSQLKKSEVMDFVVFDDKVGYEVTMAQDGDTIKGFRVTAIDDEVEKLRSVYASILDKTCELEVFMEKSKARRK